MAFLTVNILDILKENEGEVVVKKLTSSFLCPKNKEIEHYLKKQSIDFAKRRLSITYFVVDDSDFELVGYYAIMIKRFDIPKSLLSCKMKHSLAQHFNSPLKEENIQAISYLITQLGKNNESTKITGSELLELAEEEIDSLIDSVGGKICIVECDKTVGKLRSFYKTNGYAEYGERKDNDGIVYTQLIKKMC